MTPRRRHPARAVARSFACAALLVLPACSEPEEIGDPTLPEASPIAEAVRQAQTDWSWVAGTEWELAAIEGSPPIESSRVWIAFKPDETWLTGSAGCNRFTGDYIRRGENGIRIAPLRLTRRFCNEPAGIMQQESRVVHLLTEATAYEASPEWFHLLADDTIVLSFRPVPTAP